MFRLMIQKLKKNPKKIVFTEGEDPRILEAAARLLSGTFLTPILIGDPEKIYKVADEECLNVKGVTILQPHTYDKMDEMVAKMVELRKGKMTEEQCRAALQKGR